MFPKGTPTAIGSWPFMDAVKASALILDKFPALPPWPQLPRLGFRENMYVQFSEGLPRLVVDEAAGKIHFDTSGDFFPAVQSVYEEFLSGKLEKFSISKPYAQGLHGFEAEVGRRGRQAAVKGQLIGPVSFGLTLTDENKKLILYNEQLADGILKVIAAKAAWQVLFLKKLADTVVVFIDEPYLVSFGSAYVNVGRNQVILMLNEVIDKIHEHGGIAGIHCCGNTDWSLLTDTNVDIINFDAYDYWESVMLYPAQFSDFLRRGPEKRLAWGIVPTGAEKVRGETPEDLLLKLRGRQAKLVGLGVDAALLDERTMLTPACGAGSLTEETAYRIIDLLGGLARLYAAG
jgi:hypothetical protein